MSDFDKWAVSTDEEIYEIAKNWAKRFTTVKLRAFQDYYRELGTKETIESRMIALDHLWQCATFAISIREFGK